MYAPAQGVERGLRKRVRVGKQGSMRSQDGSNAVRACKLALQRCVQPRRQQLDAPVWRLKMRDRVAADALGHRSKEEGVGR